MPLRATRSRTRAARITDAVATGPLGALSHDELGVIFDGLANPLQPAVSVALSSTCLGLRTPLRAVLQVLKEQHARVAWLCARLQVSCRELREAKGLMMGNLGLDLEEIEALGMILRSNGLPSLELWDLSDNCFRDADLQLLCASLCPGALPSLRELSLNCNKLGPRAASELAAALRRGAMPNLVKLFIGDNPILDEGMTALAPQLSKLPRLEKLFMWGCVVGDEGVASLCAERGENDFKKLTHLDLDHNDVGDMGCATLASALKAGVMPKLIELSCIGNRFVSASFDAVIAAMRQRLVTSPTQCTGSVEPPISE